MQLARLHTPPLQPSPPREERLLLSLAASLLAHALALAMFAGLLFPMPASISFKLGDSAVMQVLLSANKQADAPNEPATTVALGAPSAPVEPVATRVPLPKPQEPPAEAMVPVRRIDLRAPAAQLSGTPTATPANPQAIVSDIPIPPGDVAVGATETPEPMGHAQALRLAQRFPGTVARAPQLQAPLVVPYPPYAARAYREARISALLIIDADGSAVEATLQPDDPLFVPTIEDALRSAKFKPAETDSRPVKHWLILDFVFTMRPPATSRSGGPRG